MGKKLKFYRVFVYFMLALALLAGLVGCGAKSASQAAASMAGYAPREEAGQAEEFMAQQAQMQTTTMEDTSAPETEAGGAEVPPLAPAPNMDVPQENRKIALTANMTIESKDFEDTYAAIRKAPAEFGGHIFLAEMLDQSNSSRKTANFTFKIPAQEYENFLLAMAKAGTVTNKSETAEDFTAQYVDIEARLKSLRTQEARLLDFMEKAVKIDDLISLESQLANVQYEIERYVAQQNHLQSITKYSTINILLLEEKVVTTLKMQSYSQRLAAALSQSWQGFGLGLQNLSIYFILSLPYLILLLAILLVLWFFVGKKIKKYLLAKLGLQSTQTPPEKP